MGKKEKWTISSSSLSHLKNTKHSKNKPTKRHLFGFLDLFKPNIGSSFKAQNLDCNLNENATQITVETNTNSVADNDVMFTDVQKYHQDDTPIISDTSKPTVAPNKQITKSKAEPKEIEQTTIQHIKSSQIEQTLTPLPQIKQANQQISQETAQDSSKNQQTTDDLKTYLHKTIEHFAWLGIFLVPFFMIWFLTLVPFLMMSLSDKNYIASFIYLCFMAFFLWFIIKFGMPSRDKKDLAKKGKISLIGWLIIFVGVSCLLFLGLLITIGFLLNEDATGDLDYFIVILLIVLMFVIFRLMKWLVKIAR